MVVIHRQSSLAAEPVGRAAGLLPFTWYNHPLQQPDGFGVRLELGSLVPDMQDE